MQTSCLIVVRVLCIVVNINLLVMKIYDRIKGLCAARNLGTSRHNGKERVTARVKWICDLLDELSLEWSMDRIVWGDNYLYNIILHSEVKEGVKVISAHHDIVLANSDNANDNSASVICAIALKLQRPETMVVLLDGEEVGGVGSTSFADELTSARFGQVSWVLNLELSGRGGKEFLLGEQGSNGPLGKRIQETLRPDIITVPFNDSVRFREAGLDSCCVNPLPRLSSGELDRSGWFLCHTIGDSLDEISVEDMEEWVEEVLVKIVDKC